MKNDNTPCCVLVLSAAEAACLQGNLLASLRGGDASLESALGVDMRKIVKAIGPGGVHDCRPSEEQRESPQAADMIDILLGADVPKSTEADPVDVVQQALDKAGGSKVIPVDFKPKGKEE